MICSTDMDVKEAGGRWLRLKSLQNSGDVLRCWGRVRRGAAGRIWISRGTSSEAWGCCRGTEMVVCGRGLAGSVEDYECRGVDEGCGRGGAAGVSMFILRNKHTCT